jgi:hypothetical protein
MLYFLNKSVNKVKLSLCYTQPPMTTHETVEAKTSHICNFSTRYSELSVTRTGSLLPVKMPLVPTAYEAGQVLELDLWGRSYETVEVREHGEGTTVVCFNVLHVL